MDKLTRIQQASRGEAGADQLGRVLDKLAEALQGKRVGILVEDVPPDQQAIDVTAEET
jgi:hypothetical protein